MNAEESKLKAAGDKSAKAELEMEDVLSDAVSSNGDVRKDADAQQEVRSENEDGVMEENKVLTLESEVLEQGMDTDGHVNTASTNVVMEEEAKLLLGAGDDSCGKTSLLTAVMCVLDDDHPPNYHESPSVRADTTLVKITFDKEVASAIFQDNEPYIFEMVASRSHRKKHSWANCSIAEGSHEMLDVSDLMKRPRPHIWLLPQGMIESLLQMHDSNLTGIFEEYFECKESSKLLKTIQSFEEQKMDLEKHISILNRYEKIIAEYKNVDKAQQVEAQKNSSFFQVVDFRSNLQSRLNDIRDSPSFDTDLWEKLVSECNRYRDVVNKDIISAVKKKLEILGKQKFIEHKFRSNGSTPVTLKKMLEEMENMIKREDDEIKVNNSLKDDHMSLVAFMHSSDKDTLTKQSEGSFDLKGSCRIFTGMESVGFFPRNVV